jgi:hypothetical protein
VDCFFYLFLDYQYFYFMLSTFIHSTCTAHPHLSFPFPTRMAVPVPRFVRQKNWGFFPVGKVKLGILSRWEIEAMDSFRVGK